MKTVTISLVVPKQMVQVFNDLASLICKNSHIDKILNEQQRDAISDGEKMRIGRLLRRYRLMNGLKQKELSNMLDVPQSHISQYELGKRWIPRKQTLILSKIFNTETDLFSRQY